MKLNNNIIGLCIVLIVMGCLNGCTKDDTKKIAIAQYIDHPMLDECRKGFLDKMKDFGYSKENTTYEYLNAQGDMSVNKSIANKFGKGKYDLIFALATPTAQAMKKTTQKSQVPVIFGAITDPSSAGLVDSIESSGNNLTGTSDAWPYYEQLKLIIKVLPNIKNIGVVYNSGETNTEYAMRETRKAAEILKVKIIESAITNTNEVALGTKNLIGKVEAIYITADNTTMAAAPIILKIAKENDIPVFAGDPGTFKSGALAGVGVSYYDLGVSSAIMANEILQNNKKPTEIKTVISKNPKLMINLKVAKILDISIPESIINNADIILK